jgi:hypothetical protein
MTICDCCESKRSVTKQYQLRFEMCDNRAYPQHLINRYIDLCAECSQTLTSALKQALAPIGAKEGESE